MKVLRAFGAENVASLKLLFSVVQLHLQVAAVNNEGKVSLRTSLLF